MRWKLLRRRLSISAPRMTVRSHLPWPLRWAVAALALGFSGALALWAFEFGKSIAGLNPDGQTLFRANSVLQREIEDQRHARERAESLANAAESLLKAEQATQARLAEQVKALEAQNQALKDDLGFFERLLPASGDGLSIRGLQADAPLNGQVRYQMLAMQSGVRGLPEFRGRCEVVLAGTLQGRPWTSTPPISRDVQFRQYLRIEGQAPIPAGVQVRQLQVRLLDEQGRPRTSQSVNL